MDIKQQNRAPLEPIREELEQEDETEERQAGEETEEDFQFQEDTEKELAEDKSEEEEDDDTLLRIMRPRRLYSSISQENITQTQSPNNQQTEMENFFVSDQSTHTADWGDEATPAEQSGLGNEKRSSSGKLTIKVTRTRWQEHTSPTPPKQKKRQSSKTLVEGQFPKWLVDLMVNIEEATTHELVIE
ncbi:VID27-like protein isoform X2 [Amphiprion ocellaris]|uniref:VID27-like protein isoform X2 n=1 Tax=Amphiprion ocellaris TaxID=80972 RepID=UPI000C30F115|nr:VID27-like protein isoform X2 [Amphiprion ocellaris]